MESPEDPDYTETAVAAAGENPKKRSANPRTKKLKTRKGKVKQCDQCEFTAGTTKGVLLHKRSKHENIRYPCDLCDFTATQRITVRRHKAFVHEGINFPCDQCDFKGRTNWYLKLHKEKEHEGVKYYCSQCDYVNPVQIALKRHIRVVHEGVRFKCDLCDFTALDKTVITKHVKVEHEGFRYNCDECEFSCKNQHSLSGHQQTQHSGIYHPCDECEFTTRDVRYLQRHKLNRHAAEAEKRLAKFACDQCSYVATAHNSLRRHKKSIHSAEVYECPHCHVVCSEKKRARHNKIECMANRISKMSQKKLTCPVCGTVVLSEQEFLTHACAPKIEEFECAACEVVLFSKADFDEHNEIYEEYHKFRAKQTITKESSTRNAKEVKITDLKCHICNIEVKSEEGMINHNRTYKTFHQYRAKIAAVRQTIPSENRSNNGMKVKLMNFSCNLCNITVQSEKEMDDHIKTNKSFHEYKVRAAKLAARTVVVNLNDSKDSVTSKVYVVPGSCKTEAMPLLIKEEMDPLASTDHEEIGTIQVKEEPPEDMKEEEEHIQNPLDLLEVKTETLENDP